MRIRRAQPVPAGSRAGLDLRLGVACPRCGAPIWLDEGVAAAACAACGEGFLVLPRIDPFAAFVAATVGMDEARHIARAFLRSGRHRATWVGSGRWRLLPYWRCRARAFQWIAGRRGGSGEADEYHHLDVQSFDLLLPAAPDSPAGPPPRPGILEAYPMAPGALPGARPEPAALGPETARTRAREEIERRSAPARTAISGRRLALVGEERMVLYLPFFSLDYRFRDEAREVLVDGLLGEVAAHRELAAAGEAAAGEAAAGEVAAGEGAPGGAPLEAPSLFLPLRCPACSARLRFAPGDRVHGCKNCGRAWEVAGRQLCEVPQRLAASTRAPGACYLPFWVVRAVAHGFNPLPGPAPGPAAGVELSVYVPAFDAWRAERLSQLAVHLTRARPSYAVQELAGPGLPAVRLGGVTLGRRDAERLAWVVLGSLASVDASVFARFLERGSVETRTADLLWLPFHPSGLYLREPVTGALVRGPVGADHRTSRAVEAPPAAPARRRAA